MTDAKSRRVRFACIFCNKRQTRHVRTGVYVTCTACGEANPGPRMLERMQQVALERPTSNNRKPRPEVEAQAPARAASVARGKVADVQPEPVAAEIAVTGRKRAVIVSLPTPPAAPPGSGAADPAVESAVAPAAPTAEEAAPFAPSGLFDRVLYG